MARNVAWQVLRASKVTINSWKRQKSSKIDTGICLPETLPRSWSGSFCLSGCEHIAFGSYQTYHVTGNTPSLISASLWCACEGTPDQHKLMHVAWSSSGSYKQPNLFKIPLKLLCRSCLQGKQLQNSDFEWSCSIKKTPLLMFTRIFDPKGWSPPEPGSPHLVILFTCVLASRLLCFICMLLYTCAYVGILKGLFLKACLNRFDLLEVLCNWLWSNNSQLEVDDIR